MANEAGLLGRLRERLGKTRGRLIGNLKRVFAGRSALTEEVIEDLEEILIEADLGVDTTFAILADMRRLSKEKRIDDSEGLLALLREELVRCLEPGDHSLDLDGTEGVHVVLVAGVNGSGKTTTIGKLAARFKGEGRSVLLGAADTFRAAATEQLTIWSERVDVPIVKHQHGADPAAVAYDATESALSKGVDCLIIDTAGRLHTKSNLMEELKKIQRVIGKRVPGAPHDVLLVLDATTGQNGLQQARVFTEALDVTGIVLTKLDGTAKGGIALAIQKELGIPIKFIGIGEGLDDLQPFVASDFVDALLEG